MCSDNRRENNNARFELMKKYKDRLIESTNITDSWIDMAAIDSILFRFWQMGWLDILEKYLQIHNADADKFINVNDFIANLNKEKFDVQSTYEDYPYLDECGYGYSKNLIKEVLNKTPAAEVTPAVHGHWVLDADNNYLCDICCYSPKDNEPTNYCAGCGAKMYERGESE